MQQLRELISTTRHAEGIGVYKGKGDVAFEALASDVHCRDAFLISNRSLIAQKPLRTIAATTYRASRQ